MIRVEGLKLGFEESVLLEGLSFHVPKAEVFAILGGSGCGKTTLMKAMVGLLAPLAGSIHIRGLPVGPVEGVAPTLSPICSMTLAGGPMKAMSHFSQVAAKRAFSAKKP